MIFNFNIVNLAIFGYRYEGSLVNYFKVQNYLSICI